MFIFILSTIGESYLARSSTSSLSLSTSGLKDNLLLLFYHIFEILEFAAAISSLKPD
jgi:hypothetical protein